MTVNGLKRAKQVKDDEFYTSRKDIENELRYYKKHLKGKIVYCNADDYNKSKFVEYFLENFNDIGLLKLYATGFSRDGKGSYMEYDGKVLKTKELDGNGDYASEECMDILEASDVIATNPPFSIFKEYLPSLIKAKKDFIILGPKNALGYKDIFPYIVDNTIKFGTFVNKVLYFSDSKTEDKGSPVLWFSTFSIDYEYPVLYSKMKYEDRVYQKYDGYDIIEVKPTKDLPYDYTGPMAVPISALKYRHNDGFLYVQAPDGHKIRYSIVGVILNSHSAVIDGKWINKRDVFRLNGEEKYKRFVIRKEVETL